MTITEIDRLLAIARAATPGPWRMAGTEKKLCPVVTSWAPQRGYQIHSMLWVKKHGEGEYPFMYETYCKDAKHIAAFSPDVVIALLEELRAAQKTPVRGASKDWPCPHLQLRADGECWRCGVTP